MRVKSLLLFVALMVLPLKAFCYVDGNTNPLIDINIKDGSSSRPHAPLRFRAEVEEINGVLQLSFIGNFSDVDIEITDADGSVVYQETNGSIYDGKVICITPADGYPYDVTITSSSLNITGVIYLE